MGLIRDLASCKRVAALVLTITSVLVSVSGRSQPATGELCARTAFQGRYCTHEIHGWSVYVSEALIRRNEGLARGALALLAQCLEEVGRTLPTVRIQELRRIPFWIGNRTDGSGLVYHPGGSRQPRETGEPDAQTGGIAIRDPHHFFNIRFSQPSVIVHELAHGYHNQVLGDDPVLLNAFRNAQEKGLYRDIERNDGTIGRAYALTNHHEYFAELSESYFGTNDFFPFRRDELQDYDPVGFAALRSLWEDRPVMADEPVSLSSGAAPGTATAACTSDAARRSRSSQEAAQLVLRNRTPHRIELLWLNFQGQPRSYARLEPGALHVQSTYLTHPWLIADSEGKCLAVVMPKKGGT